MVSWGHPAGLMSLLMIHMAYLPVHKLSRFSCGFLVRFFLLGQSEVIHQVLADLKSHFHPTTRIPNSPFKEAFSLKKLLFFSNEGKGVPSPNFWLLYISAFLVNDNSLFQPKCQ